MHAVCRRLIGDAGHRSHHPSHKLQGSRTVTTNYAPEVRIFTTPVSSVYPLYLAKVERKGRSRDELDAVLTWLTGYDDAQLAEQLAVDATFEEFFAGAGIRFGADWVVPGYLVFFLCLVSISVIDSSLADGQFCSARRRARFTRPEA